jgi:Protein of unknown function (DUF2846)
MNIKTALDMMLLSAVAVPFLFITGCASVPPASEQDRATAISFTPPVGQAGVYLFRPSAMLGSAVQWKVYLDDAIAGKVAVKSYLYLVVQPGYHEAKFGDGVSQPGAAFNAEAGKNYFFAIQPFGIKSISESEGRQFAGEYTLSSLCGPEWVSAQHEYFIGKRWQNGWARIHKGMTPIQLAALLGYFPYDNILYDAAKARNEEIGFGLAGHTFIFDGSGLVSW